MIVEAGTPKLGRTSSAFALAAAITIAFNTLLACVKDAYTPLKHLMTSVSHSDWTTQGVADVVLFVILGLIFLRTRLAEKLNPHRLTSLLVGTAMLAGAGLFAWYVLH
jgi:uncharacterized membrane protein SirB2